MESFKTNQKIFRHDKVELLTIQKKKKKKMCKNLITIKHKNLVKVKIYSKKAETSNKSGIFFPII